MTKSKTIIIQENFDLLLVTPSSLYIFGVFLLIFGVFSKLSKDEKDERMIVGKNACSMAKFLVRWSFPIAGIISMIIYILFLLLSEHKILLILRDSVPFFNTIYLSSFFLFIIIIHFLLLKIVIIGHRAYYSNQKENEKVKQFETWIKYWILFVFKIAFNFKIDKKDEEWTIVGKNACSMAKFLVRWSFPIAGIIFMIIYILFMLLLGRILLILIDSALFYINIIFMPFFFLFTTIIQFLLLKIAIIIEHRAYDNQKENEKVRQFETWNIYWNMLLEITLNIIILWIVWIGTIIILYSVFNFNISNWDMILSLIVMCLIYKFFFVDYIRDMYINLLGLSSQN